LNFARQGLPHRFRKKVQSMRPGDRVAYYVMGLQKFGATATITGEYYNDDQNRLWTDRDEIWPARCPSSPDVVLQDDELVDAKKLLPDLSFIKDKDHWGAFFQGSIRTIPEDDFRLIESEMRKALSERPKRAPSSDVLPREDATRSEAQYEKLIMALPLQTASLHDRLGEMLESIGSWMDFNPQTRHKIAADHAYELDVAWLKAKNPEVAVEIQISGNLTEAKDRLAQARKFNYRKVILVLREKDMTRLNSLMRHEPELRSWMEAWSVWCCLSNVRRWREIFQILPPDDRGGLP
ncbi:MAG TPA: EVE domain-containing protein, partial [Candidatus Kryptonia bacterium]|nr:EVE domain-containing protein [Candidatus Kryptonia bacterium]